MARAKGSINGAFMSLVVVFRRCRDKGQKAIVLFQEVVIVPDMTLRVLIMLVLLSACSELEQSFEKVLSGTPKPEEQIEAETGPEPPVAATSPINADGQSAEALDTTTATERAEAARSGGGGAALGETIVSLGDPARPDFWIETPLVSTEGPGRVVNPANGASAQVTLVPISGPETGGSRLSLAAMRLLEAPLTELVPVQVFSGG